MRQPDSTEDRHAGTVDIDTWEPQAAIEAILTEDLAGVRAALAVSGELASLVEQAHARIRSGGRIHYFGAGASGRLAFLDATESRPTFGVEGLFAAHFPGGPDALLDSSIDREDAEASGAEDAGALTSDDVAIGVTASGSTAYVRGALAEARRRGAYTALIAHRAGATLSNSVDLAIEAATGPEALTGSTRLKAGTTTKVLINAFSTALMMRAGRTWSNLMVQMVATNSKLDERAVQILAMATGCPGEECGKVLTACAGELPVALTAMLTGATPEASRRALAAGGGVRDAVQSLS